MLALYYDRWIPFIFVFYGDFKAYFMFFMIFFLDGSLFIIIFFDFFCTPSFFVLFFLNWNIIISTKILKLWNELRDNTLNSQKMKWIKKKEWNSYERMTESYHPHRKLEINTITKWKDMDSLWKNEVNK